MIFQKKVNVILLMVWELQIDRLHAKALDVGLLVQSITPSNNSVMAKEKRDVLCPRRATSPAWFHSMQVVSDNR